MLLVSSLFEFVKSGLGSASRCAVFFASFSFSVISSDLHAICDANPGVDGNATATGTPGTVSYHQTTASVSAGSTSISLSSTAGLSAGDMVLVIQMQGADIDTSNTDSYGDGVAGSPASGWISNANFTAGRYEYASIASVGAGSITLSAPLINSYMRRNFGTNGQARFQVIRVPQYDNLTLTGNVTAPAWNGETGGVLPIDVANTLNFNGFQVDLSARGFRGGGGAQLTGIGGYSNTDYRQPGAITNPGANGSKGEGIAGTPRYVYNGTARVDTGVVGYLNGSFGRGAPGTAGGGGTDGRPSNNDENSGGGGGGNGGAGANGGNSWNSNLPVGGEGGSAFASAANRLVLGGGGGAATGNNGNAPPPHGGVGGGMVLIRAHTIQGTGTINVNGGNGTTPNPTNDGGGGGGAGGSVILLAEAQIGSITVTARGGAGGNAHPGGVPHGPGGGGGGGAIFVNDAISPSIDASQGASGYTVNPGTYFGAPPAGGQVGSGVPDTDPDDVDGTDGGAECVTNVDLSIVKTRSGGLMYPGSSSQFQIDVSSAGPDTTDQDIIVTDVLDSKITYSTFSGTGWSCVEAPAQTVTCTHAGTLASGASLPSLFIDVNINGGTSGVLSNTATVSGGSTVSDLDASDNSSTINDFIYAPVSGNKNLYLYPTSSTVGTIQRVVPNSDDTATIERGNGAGRYIELDLSPNLADDITINNDILLHLCLRRVGNNGNRRVRSAFLLSDDTVIGAETPNYTTTDSNWHWNTFVMTHTGPTTITPAQGMKLRITNRGTDAGNRDIEISSNGAGGDCAGSAAGATSSTSHVVLDASTVINVDSITVYNDASPSGVQINNTVESAIVYVRSIVSDPFGFADINNNTTVEVLDNTNSVVVGPLADTAILSQSGSTKEFEYTVPMPNDRTDGPFTIRVTANEGTEGTVTHQNAVVFSLTDPPLLVVSKASGQSTAAPDDELDYLVTVSNTSILGTGDASNVIVIDELPQWTSFKVGTLLFSDAPVPFSSSNLSVASIQYLDEAAAPVTPTSGGGGAPAGYDARVREIRVTFSGIMPPDGGFSLAYTLLLN